MNPRLHTASNKPRQTILKMTKSIRGERERKKEVQVLQGGTETSSCKLPKMLHRKIETSRRKKTEAPNEI